MLIVCVYVCIWIYMQILVESRRCCGSGITGKWELFDMSAYNQSWFLRKMVCSVKCCSVFLLPFCYLLLRLFCIHMHPNKWQTLYNGFVEVNMYFIKRSISSQTVNPPSSCTCRETAFFWGGRESELTNDYRMWWDFIVRILLLWLHKCSFYFTFI